MDEFTAFPLPVCRWRRVLSAAVPVVLAHAMLAGAAISRAETPPPRPAPLAVPGGDAPEPHKVTVPTAANAPVYRTRLPPSTVVRYVITRGPWSGNGELVWELQDNRYHARLEGRVAGIRVLTQDSTGQVDPAGIAPVRFTDERRGKSARAADFQRAAGKITYSGSATEHALVPGTQDRLTWMVQVAAIAAADPRKVAAGQRLGLFVTGARGDADVWTFQAMGTETVTIGGQPVLAVKLVREARKPHDTLVEVWLDPKTHHLPVRARMTNQPEGETFELLRQGGDPS